MVSIYISLFLLLLISQFRRKDYSNLFVFLGNESTIIFPHLPLDITSYSSCFVHQPGLKENFLFGSSWIVLHSFRVG